MSDAKSVVQSAAKTFAVLRAFGAEQAELTISEVGERAGLDRGTSFRFVNTLIALGYLAAIPGSRRFRLTLKCLDLGCTALCSGGLRAMAAPLLRDPVPAEAGVDTDALMDRLAMVRAQGYAIADGENAYGPCTVAAPVLDAFAAASLPLLARVSADLAGALARTQPVSARRHA